MNEAKQFLGLLRAKSIQAFKGSQDSDKKTHEHRNPHRHRRELSLPSHTVVNLNLDSSKQQAESSRTQEKDVSPEVSSNLTYEAPRWPPPGLSETDEITRSQAENLITKGVPIFEGHRLPIPHASDEYYALYALCRGDREPDADCAKFLKSAFTASTLQLGGPGLAAKPWDTLEQPSLAFCYGDRPGTITLNQWIASSGKLNPHIKLRDPGVSPKDVDLKTILERLRYLERDFEEDDPEIMYKNLYGTLLKDPDKYFSPHIAMEKQVTDLLIILSNPHWIDFSDPRNQIVGKFFSSVCSTTDNSEHRQFFHQLLLSTELELRINSKHHAEEPKQQLLSQLPPSIAWDLALARKWRECMSMERVRHGQEQQTVKFHLRLKRKQAKALRKFATAMKWPNPGVDELIHSRNGDARPVEELSSDSMSYFSGVILPGNTLPWLLMNSLIDCDKETGDSLMALTHMHPSSGFQYRTTTYWSSSCIVGKVLAPTCQEIAGWIGPGPGTPDLGRIHIAQIRQRPSKQILDPKVVQNMHFRSDPLGPQASTYPVSDYQLLVPDSEVLTDSVRIEKLALNAVPRERKLEGKLQSRSETYDACIQFAIEGRSWPLRLSFDVSFIFAFPCSGTHPLFIDYVYKAVRVDELLSIRDWGGVSRSLRKTSSVAESSAKNLNTKPDDDELERVLVVEAFGVPDNEVLCRAYCAHWGLSAIVANIEKTCMACAIREAYAACINICILVGSHHYDSQS